MRTALPLPTPLESPGVVWSIEVLDCVGARSFVLEPERVQSSASVGKLLLLTEVARQIVGGELSTELLLTRTPEDSVSDSGLWQYLSVDRLSVMDAAVLVSTVSDNLATNVLLRNVGLTNVQQLGSSLGFKSLQLHDRVRDVRTSQDSKRLSSASAADLVHFFDLLTHSQLVSAPVSQLIEGWLLLNADLSMVASAFDLDPLAHRASLLANKTGTDSGVRADSGRVFGPKGPVIYAAVANWDPTKGDPVGAVLRDMRAIGGLVMQLALAQ